MHDPCQCLPVASTYTTLQLTKEYTEGGKSDRKHSILNVNPALPIAEQQQQPQTLGAAPTLWCCKMLYEVQMTVEHFAHKH